MKKILVISDIHGNFPALRAIAEYFPPGRYDLIINSGDCTVYAPFPNQVLEWLQVHNVVTIAGNTDRKVKKLLRGKTFKKPSKAEKRIMYTSTAAALTPENRTYLTSLKKKKYLKISGWKMGVFHGSPAHADEFLFPDTPEERFVGLAATCPARIIIIGHSHTPFYKVIGDTHFINPGSVGRMFDGDPRASCAELYLGKDRPAVLHHRIPYRVDEVVRELQHQSMPPIYSTMYQVGKKLN